MVRPKVISCTIHRHWLIFWKQLLLLLVTQSMTLNPSDNVIAKPNCLCVFLFPSIYEHKRLFSFFITWYNIHHLFVITYGKFILPSLFTNSTHSEVDRRQVMIDKLITKKRRIDQAAKHDDHTGQRLEICCVSSHGEGLCFIVRPHQCYILYLA